VTVESARDAKYAVSFAAEEIRETSRRSYEALVEALKERHYALLLALQGADPSVVLVAQGRADAVYAILQEVINCNKVVADVDSRRKRESARDKPHGA
jgi:hypothetical protein